MFKLEYPSGSPRWPNDLVFQSWDEYWKTLGFLSNPKIHQYYIHNGSLCKRSKYDVSIRNELNTQTNSYTDTARIYYYGLIHDSTWFSSHFYDLHAVSIPVKTQILLRINRKEFGETLLNDLGFLECAITGTRDHYIIPEKNNVALKLACENSNFNLTAWQEGWNLAE